MVTEVYGHIIDEDRRKNAQRMEDAFYNRENLNPQMKGADAGQIANTVAVPEGVDADLLDRKSTRLNSSHVKRSRMPSSA